MADIAGDPDKKPPECVANWTKCPHIKETSGTNMESERYECERCGEYFHLYYEDMQ